MDDSDDHYKRAEEEDRPVKESRTTRCMAWVRKFFLALIALGLVALLVFQIILMGSTADIIAVPPISADLTDISTDIVT